MQPASPNLARSELRDLRRGLATVTDPQLVQVVALIDRMADRGAADALIEPLRARLGQVRPPRPLRFSRLLFLPLDPVIVPAAGFRAGTPTVPRTAVAPLAAAVQAALGPYAAEIEAAIVGRTTADVETVQRVGEGLWPEAATVLARAPQPPGWAAAGLPAALYRPLAAGIAAVLEQAVALQTVIADGMAGLPISVEVVDAALAKAAANGPSACSFVLAVLLSRLPDADVVLQRANVWTAQQGNPALRAAFDQASEAQFTLLESHDDAETEMVGPDLAAAGAQVHRIIGLLARLGDATAPAARRARVEAIRNRLDASCRTRFANSLASEFLAPLHASVQSAEPAALQRLETTARQLRALESEARCLGSAPSYDALLSETAIVVRNLAPDTGLGLAEKVRLIEILAGPEEALALLT
jgi:hypothetical protein